MNLRAALGRVHGFAVAPELQEEAYRLAESVDAEARARGRCDTLVAESHGYVARWLGSDDAIATCWGERAATPSCVE